MIVLKIKTASNLKKRKALKMEMRNRLMAERFYELRIGL